MDDKSQGQQATLSHNDQINAGECKAVNGYVSFEEADRYPVKQATQPHIVIHQNKFLMVIALFVVLGALISYLLVSPSNSATSSAAQISSTMQNARNDEAQNQASQQQPSEMKLDPEAAFRPSPPITIYDNPRWHYPFYEHKQEKLRFPYATMGMRKPGTYFNFTIASMGNWIEYEKPIGDLIKPYVNTNCQLQVVGGLMDGGYVVCTNLIAGRSVALINLGVEGRDSFGCDLSTRYNIPNFQYDCTSGSGPVCPSNNNNDHFRSICMAQRAEKSVRYQLESLKDMIDNNGLTRKHIVVKMDIEGGEYKGLRTLPIDYLEYIDQIFIEFHIDGPRMMYQPEAYWGNHEIFKSLDEHFVSVWEHQNSCWPDWYPHKAFRYMPAFTIEATLVNKRIIELHSKERSHKELFGPKGERLYYHRGCEFPDDHP